MRRALDELILITAAALHDTNFGKRLAERRGRIGAEFEKRFRPRLSKRGRIHSGIDGAKLPDLPRICTGQRILSQCNGSGLTYWESP